MRFKEGGMDNILIIGGDREYLDPLNQSFAKLHLFNSMVADDAEQAISFLEKMEISVIVLDFHSIDGLDFLAHMTRHYPNMPCIVLASKKRPWFFEHLDQQELLYYVEKPFELSILVEAVMVALMMRDEGMIQKRTTVGRYLPLIEIDGRSCCLQVTRRDKVKGFCYFKDGDLIDAQYGKLRGEPAAAEIASWEGVSLKFSHLPKQRTDQRVTTSLMEMAGASWQRLDVRMAEEPEPELDLFSACVSV